VSLAEADADSALLTERPDPPGTPTKVDVLIYLFDVYSIDDVEQQFNVDLFLKAEWQDRRLALPEAQRQGKIRQFSLDEIWLPRTLMLNDRNLEARLPLVAQVDDEGRVSLGQRLFGTASADLQFRDFPMETQYLPLDLISYGYKPEELDLGAKAVLLGDAESFSADGWNLSLLEPEHGVYSIPELGTERPRLTFRIEATRDSSYYLSTMFLPMSLIVFMAWTVFWLQPDLVPPRISIATGAIFSLIAFGFSIRLSLPKIPYMTRADMFVLGSTLLVFIALAVAVAGSRLAVSGRMEQALKVNAVARLVYAALFVALLLAAWRL